MNRAAPAPFDPCDWILSPAIRRHLQACHRFSVEEKAAVISGACRAIGEKYEALGLLLEEASEEEERALVTSLRRLYRWAFDELRQERPGQVFVFHEVHGCEAGERHFEYGGVDEMFRTFSQLSAYLEEFHALCKKYRHHRPGEPSREACIEKWALVEGRMQAVAAFDLFTLEGRLCFQRFHPWLLSLTGAGRRRGEALGIAREAVRLHGCDRWNTLPLPFRTGDLVRLEPYDWEGPLYGVLSVTEAGGRYVDMVSIRGHCLQRIPLTWWNVDLTSAWPVIDCLHPADPSELPEGQEVLAELGRWLRSPSGEGDMERLLSRLAGDRPEPAVVRPLSPLTLGELLGEALKDDDAFGEAEDG